MHSHTVDYIDFNGVSKTKELLFNLTEAELTKMQKNALAEGGIQVQMDHAVKSGDTKLLLDFFEKIVRESYGIKSADGEVFDKSEEIWNRFENSAFYSPLYMSFLQDEGSPGAEFIRQVLPAELISAAEANVRGEGELARKAEEATKLSENLKPSAQELFNRSREGLQDRRPSAQAQAMQAAQAAQAPYMMPTELPIQDGNSIHVPQQPHEMNQAYRVPSEGADANPAGEALTAEQWEARQRQQNGQ